MASREGYSIKNYWKYYYNLPRKYALMKYENNDKFKKLNIFIIFYLRINSILYLFKKLFKYNRKTHYHYFYIDNFRVPFFQLIGCKISKHKWFYMEDEERAFCLNCHVRTDFISIEKWKRINKLNKIKRKIKK